MAVFIHKSVLGLKNETGTESHKKCIENNIQKTHIMNCYSSSYVVIASGTKVAFKIS